MEKLNEWKNSIPYLTLSKIKTLFINLLQGLIFIHSKGVVHADIKIENILEYDGRLIYTDFGLSCFEPKCDEFSGTIKYMDPALYITYQGMLDINYEKEKISYDSDVYSLGCVFYYIMMNEDYYDLKDAADTYEEYFELYTRKINKLEKRYLGGDNFVKKMKSFCIAIFRFLSLLSSIWKISQGYDRPYKNVYKNALIFEPSP